MIPEAEAKYAHKLETLTEHHNIYIIKGAWGGGSVVVSSSPGDKNQNISIPEYVRTRCTAVARRMTLNFW